MFETYIVDGEQYNVSPDKLDKFLQEFPDAIKMSSQDDSMSSFEEPKEKIGALENIWNNLWNAGEESYDVVEYWGFGKEEGGQSSLDIATAAIGNAVFGEENVEKFIEDQPDWLTKGLGQEEIRSSIQEWEKEQAKKKQTIGISEAWNDGDPLRLASAIAGAVINVGGSVVKNIGTLGTGYFMDFVAENYINYNTIKAEQQGKTLDQLIQDGDADEGVAIGLGAAQAGLEYFGFSKIMKGLKGGNAPGVGKWATSKLAEKALYNKSARTALGMLGSGTAESFTEMGQYGLTELGKDIAKGKAEGKPLDAWDAVDKLTDHMFSEEGIESGLQGFFGGAGISGSGNATRTMANIRKAVDPDAVENNIDRINDLNNELRKAKDPKEVEAIKDLILEEEIKLSDKVKKGNKIAESLTQTEIKEIDNLSDLADVQAAKMTELNKDKRFNRITPRQYTLRKNKIAKEYAKNKQGILDIINNKKLDEQLKTVNKAWTGENRNVIIEEDPVEFQKQYDKLGKESINVQNVDGFIAGDNIYINKARAKELASVAVGSHELLHGIMRHAINDANGNITTEGLDLVNAFRNQLSEKEANVVEKRINANYKFDENGKEKKYEDYAEEYLNAFSDAIVKGEISYNETLFTKIGRVLSALFRRKGFDTIKFNNGKDVYDFVKNYSVNIKENKISEDVQSIIDGTKKIKVGDIKFSKSSSDQVQNIYNEKGTAGLLEILDLYKPMVYKLVSKYENVPGFERRLLSDEIMTGKRGIMDMVMDYNPESGVPLAAYINKYIKLRSIESANRVLKQEFEMDVTEARGVAGDMQVDIDIDIQEQENTPRLINPLDLIKDVALKQKYEDAIKAKIPSLNINELSFKNLKDLAPEITSEIIGIPVKKITDPTANLSKSEKDIAVQFIKNNALDLMKLLPEGAVVEAASEKLIGTSTGLPKSLLNKFYTKQKRITKGAGLSPYIKNKNINPKDFLAAFGIVEGKKPSDFSTRSPEAQAVKSMIQLAGKLMTNTAVRKELGDIEGMQNKIQDIAAGKSKVQFSISEDNKSLENVFMEDQDMVKSKDEFLAANKRYDPIVKDNTDDTPLNPKKASDRLDFKTWSSNVLYKTIPEIVTVGTLANSGDWVSRGSDKSNFFLLGKDDVNSVTKGVKTRKLDKDIQAAVKRESYTNIESKLKDPAFNKRQDQSIKGLYKIWKALEGLIAKDKGNIKYIAGLLRGISSSQRHFMRTGAPIRFYTLNTDGIREEHTMPASVLAKFLFQAAIDGNIDKVWPQIEQNYYQGALSINYDNKLKGISYDGKKFNYTAVVPSGWKTTDNILARYFNMNVAMNDGGINPNDIIWNDGKSVYEKFNINSSGSVSPQSVVDAVINKRKQNIEALAQYKIPFTKNKTTKQLRDFARKYDKAVKNTLNPSQKEKGISVFDFDDTIARTSSKILVTMPDGSKMKIDATRFAKESADLEAAGATFDFSDFNKVVDGKKGPLADLALKRQDKFGGKDIFILTARPQEAAYAIHAFLKGIGLEIPIDNITGLEDGKPEAKAEWIIGKVSEGYNNFYFADDAYKNVKAVQEVMNQFDMKSDVQQAKIKFSKSLNENFEKMIEDTTGVESYKTFSRAAAKSRGADVGKWKIFLPPSAEDFMGLMYPLFGKGKKGEQQKEFINKALMKPYWKAMRDIASKRQQLSDDFRALKKKYPDVKKRLGKISGYNNFTNDQVVRIYLWHKNGHKIPGLSKKDIKNLLDIIQKDNGLRSFADDLQNVVQLKEGYLVPSEHWLSGNTAMDMMNIVQKVKRKEYLEEFIRNKEAMFTPETMNKLEAIYGTDWRNAFEDIIYRMENGTNRNFGNNKLVNEFQNWVNNSVGAVMFFNIRSAVLQTISFANFINWSDNNPLKVAMTVADQPQFWKDFSYLFNSKMLKQRRSGLQTDVNQAELANAVAGSKNKASAALSYLLQIGFLPTQMADSFAISFGGASFYRNRVNTYKKKGLSQQEAETKAFNDFQTLTEEAQQSSNPALISSQQAGPLGRLILAWQNTPMQYTRLIKKSVLDIKNGRGDLKTNISKIIYYGAIQNIIFSALQNAMFGMLFDDEEELDKDGNPIDPYAGKKTRVINNMVDTLLRGSGVYGAGVSTVKNMVMKFIEQEGKGYRADHAYTMIEAINLSPPIGSKARKIYSATQSYKFNRDVIKERGFNIDNPAADAITGVLEAATNAPLNNTLRKLNNYKQAMNNEHEAWQRIALALGWSTWDVNVKNTDLEKLKEEIKKNKKNKGANVLNPNQGIDLINNAASSEIDLSEILNN